MSAAPQTWREALTVAFTGVDRAYEHRRATVQAAYDAGLSFRQIAEAVGGSPSGVHQIIGKQGQRDGALLDDLIVAKR